MPNSSAPTGGSCLLHGPSGAPARRLRADGAALGRSRTPECLEDGGRAPAHRRRERRELHPHPDAATRRRSDAGRRADRRHRGVFGAGGRRKSRRSRPAVRPGGDRCAGRPHRRGWQWFRCVERGGQGHARPDRHRRHAAAHGRRGDDPPLGRAAAGATAGDRGGVEPCPGPHRTTGRASCQRHAAGQADPAGAIRRGGEPGPRRQSTGQPAGLWLRTPARPPALRGRRPAPASADSRRNPHGSPRRPSGPIPGR